MIKRNNMIIIIFLFILSSISIGYAYLNSNLSINGYSSISASNWNIYWDNIDIADLLTLASLPAGGR